MWIGEVIALMLKEKTSLVVLDIVKAPPEHPVLTQLTRSSKGHSVKLCASHSTEQSVLLQHRTLRKLNPSPLVKILAWVVVKK